MKKTIILATALLAATMYGFCGNSNNKTEPSKTSKQEIIKSDAINGIESTQDVDPLLKRLFNTSWTFTDAEGKKFTIVIHQLSRDDKSVKAEIFINGETIGSTTIGTTLSHQIGGKYNGYVFGSGGTSRADIVYPDKSYNVYINYTRWDYENNFIYEDDDSYNSESAVHRLPIRKIQ